MPMEIIETTKPVERTFEITHLTGFELKILRQSLTKFIEDEESYRQEQNEQREARHKEMVNTLEHGEELPERPVLLPESKEETQAKEMLDFIREVERTGMM